MYEVLGVWFSNDEQNSRESSRTECSFYASQATRSDVRTGILLVHSKLFERPSVSFRNYFSDIVSPISSSFNWLRGFASKCLLFPPHFQNSPALTLSTQLSHCPNRTYWRGYNIHDLYLGGRSFVRTSIKTLPLQTLVFLAPPGKLRGIT
jgi:hypothetical protein